MNIKILIDKNTLEATTMEPATIIKVVDNNSNQIEIEVSIPDKEQEYN